MVRQATEEVQHPMALQATQVARRQVLRRLGRVSRSEALAAGFSILNL